MVAIYEVGKNLPREEKYGIISPMQRAAASVPANIAEGWARGKTGEYVQFLRVWRGSLMELETHVIIAQRLNFICNNDLLNLQQEI